jgi:hypothetical protein
MFLFSVGTENCDLEISLLSKKIFPELKLSKPAITLNNDVLPQADGPTRQITLLIGILRLILSNIFLLSFI